MSADLDLGAISAKAGDKYSPNLHRWLKHWPYRGAESAPEVFRNTDGLLYIGIVHDDGWFSGALLNTVLCNGVRADIGAYAPPFVAQKLKRVDGFWEAYQERGRCAIDPEHRVNFQGDTRWSADGDSRRCAWCGHVQYRRRWTESVERSGWFDSPDAAGCAAFETETRP